MLTVDLARLWREGSVDVEAEIPADSDLWEDTGVRWKGPVDVRLTATSAGTGEVVARGSIRGALDQECKRCLEPVARTFDLEATMVFVSSESDAEDEGGGEYVYDPSDDLDLLEAVREEVVLAVDPYVVCSAECRGLCPGCGVDLNVGECTCEDTDLDPRWEALRALKEK